jgi:hypothetical protein
MLAQVPLVDWITLTSFQQIDYHQFVDAAVSLADVPKTGAVLQYAGAWHSACFVGVGVQKGREHFILRVSGEEAHGLLSRLLRTGGHCTRIDLQITLPCPARYSARKLADSLRRCQKDERRHVTLIENTDGLDTIYVGSRQSEQLIRLYVKRPDADPDHLRFEVEYKGPKAEAVWLELRQGTSLNAILANAIETCGKDDLGILASYWNFVQPSTVLKIARSVADEQSTLLWVTHAVLPALERLLSSHRYGPIVYSYLKSLLIEFDNKEDIHGII